MGYDVAPLVQCLPNMQSPAFDSQNNIKLGNKGHLRLACATHLKKSLAGTNGQGDMGWSPSPVLGRERCLWPRSPLVYYILWYGYFG